MKAVISTVFLVPRVVSSAFAADSAVVCQSGILVSVFVNVFALIVVVLLVPALFMLVRFIEVSVESVRQSMCGVYQGAGSDRKEAPVAESTPDGG